MIIGIIGSGGREHSICCELYKSEKVKKIYCFPGNAGTENIAENIKINIKNFSEIKKFIIKKKIDLMIIGPEKPLVDGIVDFLEENNIKTFGPNKLASQLEGSKIFTKKICQNYKIPTAKFGIFRNIKSAYLFIKKTKFPLVVKADGLAAGKGVYICENKKQAQNSIKEIFNGKFGVAKNILVEEFLNGEEMSYFIISDGKSFKKFQTAQDHKRVLEGDKGKNTGGMGAYSPSRMINKNLDEKIINKIIKPTLKALKDLGCEYKGFLYAGLMIVENEPYLIEYNVRMGDPECQTILPRLKTNFVDILIAYSQNRLSEINIKWHKKKSLCIVLCSKGYPDKYINNSLIKNIKKIKIDTNEYVYHAGTVKKENKIFSSGGRVLNLVALSNNFKDSRNKCFKLIKNLDWSNGFYRKDIGYKVIN
ncbi:MAG: phosphoribosylamine--glycine ligase [Pelagibacterales bacterium]|nr:phosphoribosylamine--glycine ligase [Pelagibacterales bacterium]